MTSTVAVVSVVVPPVIVSGPAGQTVNTLGLLSLGVVAGGTGPLGYQWWKDGVAVAGASNAVLNLTPATTNAAGSYRVVVGNAAGSVTSAVAAVVVNRLSPGLAWAAPGAVGYGTALGGGQLNATAQVPGTFSYAPGPGTVLGAGTRPLGVVFTPADGATYAGATGSVSLVVNPAGLEVRADNQTREYGRTNPVLTVSYRGFVNGEGPEVLASAGLATTAATSNSPPGNYAITAGGAAGANYAVTHVNGVLGVYANSLVLVSQPTNVTVAAGGTVSLSVGAGGTGPFGYQWWKDGAAVAGASNAVLSLTPATTNAAGSYWVVVTNVSGAVTSTVAVVSVVPAIIASDPANTPTAIRSQGFVLRLPATTQNESVVVQVSEDLINWRTLAAFDSTASANTFLDVAAASTPRRFYRVQLLR